MKGDWREREALITVKAYPNPSAKHHETVCVAAITKEEGWIRIYPVQFRTMPPEKRFKKFQLVCLKLRRHERDSRPESYRVDEDSIRLLNIKKDWASRWEWIEPTVSRSMCEILTLQESTGKSLGVFQPKEVTDFVIEKTEAKWSGKKQSGIDQLSLFDEKTTKLEKIPFVFKYRYVCNEPNCNGHAQSILDWELMQLYRNVRDSGAAIDELKRKLRKKYLDEICGANKDTYFFVGNHNQYRASFMVLGAFWPPAMKGDLFRKE